MEVCVLLSKSIASAGIQAVQISAIFYANTDEFHQLFVPGRTGRLLDIGIDSCGALLGSLILLFFVYRADQREVAKKMGISRSYVSRLEKRAIAIFLATSRWVMGICPYSP